ncbi:MAG: hypothetical protein GC200_10195 [Tepidisphaera sp.]|nr:hypothetical protein [Tepidisphaera sp.]
MRHPDARPAQRAAIGQAGRARHHHRPGRPLLLARPHRTPHHVARPGRRHPPARPPRGARAQARRAPGGLKARASRA